MTLTNEHLTGDATELNVELNDLRRRIANNGEYSPDEVALAIKVFRQDANKDQAASTAKKTTAKKSTRKTTTKVDLTDLMDTEIK